MKYKTRLIIIFIIIIALFPLNPAIYNILKTENTKKTDITSFNHKIKATADLLNNNSEASVRIMSMNLLAHYSSWGGNAVKNREEYFFTVKNELKPDIIGLQEMCNEWYCTISTKESDYLFVDSFTTAFPQKMTSMIFNKNTVNLLDCGSTAFTKATNFKTRRMIWGKFKSNKTKDIFIVINTHFTAIQDEKSEENQALQACEVKELYTFSEQLYAAHHCPIIIIGDFNTARKISNNKTINSGSYGILTNFFTDAKEVAKTIYSCECKSFTNTLNDHIFLKGNINVNKLILLSQKELVLLSDHFPLIADIDFKNKP